MPDSRRQEVERAALGGEQVAGAGGDTQQLLVSLDAVAVQDVPLDLELLRTDEGDDGLGDVQTRDRTALAGGEVTGGHGVLGDGREGGHVLAVGEVLLDGDMRDVLDLDGVQTAVGEELGESRVEAALQLVGAVLLLVAGAAAAVAAAARGRGADLDQRYVHGLGAGTVFGRAHGYGSLGASAGCGDTGTSGGLTGGKSAVSVRRSAVRRSGSRRTTR